MDNIISLVNLAKEYEMKKVNMWEAKTDLSKLVKMIEDKEEDCILIARNGKAVAKIIPFQEPKSRIGAAAGMKMYEGDFDELNEDIFDLFGTDGRI